MPDAVIVIPTTSTVDEDLFEAIKSGACGYLLKSLDSNELVEALDQVRQGTPPFFPGLAAKLLNEFARIGHPKQPLASQTSAETVEPASGGMLSFRQIEVLKMVAAGLSYKEIGARLHLSPCTIKYHTVK